MKSQLKPAYPADKLDIILDTVSAAHDVILISFIKSKWYSCISWIAR